MPPSVCLPLSRSLSPGSPRSRETYSWLAVACTNEDVQVTPTGQAGTVQLGVAQPVPRQERAARSAQGSRCSAAAIAAEGRKRRKEGPLKPAASAKYSSLPLHSEGQVDLSQNGYSLCLACFTLARRPTPSRRTTVCLCGPFRVWVGRSARSLE